jgi:hypothetical protein
MYRSASGAGGVPPVSGDHQQLLATQDKEEGGVFQMKRKFLAIASALALTCAGLVASGPAEAAIKDCKVDDPWGYGSKPARYAIWVSGSKSTGGYGAKVYFYNSTSSATEHSTTSGRVTEGLTQAQGGTGTIYSRGGKWK